MRRLLAAILLLPLLALPLLAGPALAVEPDEMLDDPKLESRAREISKGLRCVVCQNENIDESNAELARDMRLLVRERLKQGDSDEEVTQFLVDRYGDYVLLAPPLKSKTYALWFGPVAFLLIAGLVGWRFYRRQAVPDPEGARADSGSGGPQPPPLSAAERRRLEKLMKDEGGSA